jgi:hypothetical protein
MRLSGRMKAKAAASWGCFVACWMRCAPQWLAIISDDAGQVRGELWVFPRSGEMV